MYRQAHSGRLLIVLTAISNIAKAVRSCMQFDAHADEAQRDAGTLCMYATVAQAKTHLATLEAGSCPVSRQ